jgi:hypothetical protein
MFDPHTIALIVLLVVCPIVMFGLAWLHEV